MIYRSYKEEYYRVPFEKAYRLNPIQSVTVIAIQNKEKKNICNANSMDVCVSVLHEQQVQCVVLYSTHMFNQRKALWILISHFVISRYPGREVRALECEESVCLNVTKRFNQRFEFFY